MNEWIIIRLGELTLKGRNRSRFENGIYNHVRSLLAAFPNVVIIKTFGRMYIKRNGEPYDRIAKQLAKAFGIVSFSPASKTELDLQAIRSAALRFVEEAKHEPKTFKVSVKRANKKFPHDTKEMNHLLGGYILHHKPGLKVDVHNPDLNVRVEIRDDGAFVYSETEPGPGGYPLGTSGMALLMLSGGIDSPVAGWYAMRKGLRLEAVHFHSFPYTSERARQKVISLARKLSEYCGDITVHMVPFADIQTRLKQEGPDHLLITFMRRAMFRICEALADRRGAGAIVTGESLGQVASQTLGSLRIIEEATLLPIIRPLVAMDKVEIIRKAEQIDTYEVSILPYEDCCTLFVPKSPATNPNKNVVEMHETKMGWLESSIAEVLERLETITVSSSSPQFDAEDELF